jgi:hypothetical protein
VWGGELAAGRWRMYGEGMGCVGVAGTVPAAGCTVPQARMG